MFIIVIESLKRAKMIDPYDEMKSDFILISNEVEAKYCIFKYGNDIAKKAFTKRIFIFDKGVE